MCWNKLKTTEAIDTITRNLDPYNPVEKNIIMHSLSTHTGGDNTGDCLARDLRESSLLSPMPRFLGVACCLHGHSLDFKSLAEKCFMLGGMKKRTLLQPLCDLHAFEN